MKDFAPSLMVAASTAEDLAAFKLTDKDLYMGIGTFNGAPYITPSEISLYSLIPSPFICHFRSQVVLINRLNNFASSLPRSLVLPGTRARWPPPVPP